MTAKSGDFVEGQIRTTVEDHIVTITLDRPTKLNALTPAMTQQLSEAVESINADREARACVITGLGRAFCVGSDIGSLDQYDTPWDFGQRVDYGDILRRLKKPLIAAINGAAMGGGLELALACDIRLAAATAVFAAPEIKLGWIGGSGQTALLVHSIGPSNAAKLILTGDPIDATTALGWGLISAMADPDRLLEEAYELAATIASRAPLAAQTAKINLHAAYSMGLDDAIALERHLQTVTFATSDATEGRAAFSERRPPNFAGR